MHLVACSMFRTGESFHLCMLFRMGSETLKRLLRLFVPLLLQHFNTLMMEDGQVKFKAGPEGTMALHARQILWRGALSGKQTLAAILVQGSVTRYASMKGQRWLVNIYI
jgi:hypothetical protein